VYVVNASSWVLNVRKSRATPERSSHPLCMAGCSLFHVSTSIYAWPVLKACELVAAAVPFVVNVIVVLEVPTTRSGVALNCVAAPHPNHWFAFVLQNLVDNGFDRCNEKDHPVSRCRARCYQFSNRERTLNDGEIGFRHCVCSTREELLVSLRLGKLPWKYRPVSYLERQRLLHRKTAEFSHRLDGHNANSSDRLSEIHKTPGC